MKSRKLAVESVLPFVLLFFIYCILLKKLSYFERIHLIFEGTHFSAFIKT